MANNGLYTPQNDKFDGYTQYPRPRVGSEATHSKVLTGTHASNATSPSSRNALLNFYDCKIKERESKKEEPAEFIVSRAQRLRDNKSGVIVNGRVLPRPNMPVNC